MSTENTVGWKRVWAIFEETIAQPSDDRTAFLNRATANDRKLRDAVVRLLEADERANPLLDRPIARAVGTPRKAPKLRSEAVPSETLGAYRLIRQIGQGGMSTVYLAARHDDEYHRRVVVKVVRRDLENELLERRLRGERQILASLNHPYIARLYDGGSTDEGRPYFVMEYVEGQPIDAYCAEYRLDIPERLALFLKVADAVGYAHQNLVVHRDLKPSNILATDQGEPRLLDFGIAKLLNPDLVGDGSEPTATWQRAMTPSYASPEQIRGQRTTTSSDVYSLGVVLYQLLTGSLPFDFIGRSPSEIERLVTDTEPPRPSTAFERARKPASPRTEHRSVGLPTASPTRWQQALSGDLDAIVLKALRSTPRERYPSVERLAADIDRYLHGLPVEARRGTWRYRTGKFIKRNRAAVVGSVALVLLLVGFAMSMSWQAAKTAEQRDEARRERDTKQRVAALMTEIFTLSNPHVIPGSELTVREAIERSMPLLEAELKDQPAIRAELLYASGSILGAIGNHEIAERQLREAYQLQRQIFGDRHPDVMATMNVLADELAELRRLDEAETMARDALTWARERYGSTSDEVVDPLIRLASILCFRAEFDGAEEAALEVLELARQIPDSERQEVIAHEYLGVVSSARGNYQKAAEHQRIVVTRRRALNGENHPKLVNPLNNLGLALRRSGDFEGALAAFQELMALQRFNFGDDFRDANTTVNLAGLQVALGAYDTAEALYRRALEELGGPTSDHPAKLHTELKLASTLVLAGKAAQAEADLRPLITRVRQTRGNDYWRVAEAESILGASLSVQGRSEEAEPLLVSGFERLIGNARARFVEDAFERLKRHLERLGRQDEVAAFQAMIDA